MLRINVLIPLVLVSCTNTTAYATDVKYWRLGIGYSAAGDAPILARPLPHHPSKGEKAAKVSQPPNSCLKKPGITEIAGVANIDSFSKVLSIVKYAAYRNVQISIKCGPEEYTANVVFEGEDENGAWWVLDKPWDSMLKDAISEWGKLAFKDQYRVKVSDDGIKYALFLKPDTHLYSFGILDGRTWVGIGSEEKIDQDALIRYGEKKGYEAHTVNKTTYSNYEVAFVIGNISDAPFFDVLRDGIQRGMDLSRTNIDLRVTRLEGDLKKKYGENYIEGMAKEYLK